MYLIDPEKNLFLGDLNLDELNADFYTGTLHKWCYAAKGTAFLWVHPKHQNLVRPLVTSHNYNKGYQEEFFKQVIFYHELVSSGLINNSVSSCRNVR